MVGEPVVGVLFIINLITKKNKIFFINIYFFINICFRKIEKA